MDIEKLIEQLNNLEFVAYDYNINGEVLGMECTEFECLMVDASTALSTLQAENEKLRAELARVKRERDAAVEYLRGQCRYCKNYLVCTSRKGPHSNCWEWRGQKEG